MLILAGVAIDTVTGDGLFSKTRQAVGEYENATRTESEQIQGLINEIDKYLTGENGGEGTDTTAPTNVTITGSNVGETTFTLTATGEDGESGISKYEFYINGTLENTVTTTAGTATYNVTGKTANTPYTCKVIVYDNAGNPKESNTITVTTKTTGVDPETVAKIGDFVNYSVAVNGVTYNKWRILDFDNNGHMEIVCYNGSSFTLGEEGNITKCKSDYANAIKLLNDASVPYKNGTYGYSTRHLGSDPSNQSSYATISTSYVKYYSNYNSSTLKPTYNLAYLEQDHHESDLNAIESFSNTAEGKRLAGHHSWLASRRVYAGSSYSGFSVYLVSYVGSLANNALLRATSNGRETANSYSYALAPVVSLESGVKINTSLAGNGSEDSPWKLTK